MNNAPQISFITICYNGLEDTCELIESLQEHIRSVSYEIFVVDNASRENEAAIIKERYPDVITIRSEENLGFSGGNNLGIKAAQGKYIFLINNDTYVDADGFGYLIDCMESDSKIGALSPKLCFATSPYNVQFAGFTPLSPITLRNETIGYDCPDDGTFDTPRRIPYLHGAAMMVKREVIWKVGLMPEEYFLYYEELDWSTQMTKAGYELWYEPCCTVYHKESRSTGLLSTLRTFYLTRNRLLYTRRNLTGRQRLLSIIYQSTLAAAKNSLVYLLKGRSDLSAAIWKGVWNNGRVANN